MILTTCDYLFIFYHNQFFNNKLTIYTETPFSYNKNPNEINYASLK